MVLVLKLVVAGEGGVGKTCLVERFCYGKYSDQRATIGTGFGAKVLNVNGQKIKLQIWDFGGEKQFRVLLPNFARGAAGALLCFDMTRYSTFMQLEEWHDILRGSTDNIPIILVGTKLDLRSERVVTTDVARDYVQKRTLGGFIETSSKENFNVYEAFRDISDLMLKKRQKQLQFR